MAPKELVLLWLIFAIQTTLSSFPEPPKVRCFYSYDEIKVGVARNAKNLMKSNQTAFEKRDLSLTLGTDDIEVRNVFSKTSKLKFIQIQLTNLIFTTGISIQSKTFHFLLKFASVIDCELRCNTTGAIIYIRSTYQQVMGRDS